MLLVLFCEVLAVFWLSKLIEMNLKCIRWHKPTQTPSGKCLHQKFFRIKVSIGIYSLPLTRICELDIF